MWFFSKLLYVVWRLLQLKPYRRIELNVNSIRPIESIRIDSPGESIIPSSSRRTGGERSVMAGVRRRNNHNWNWMWWAYRSSDSSRQCHSVANNTADRLNGLRQSYHPQPTLHELRARRFSKIHSTVDFYSTASDLKSVEKSRPQFEHSSGSVTSRYTVANRWEQVNKAGKLGRRLRSRLRQRSCGAQPMRTQIQTVTGTNTYANM